MKTYLLAGVCMAAFALVACNETTPDVDVVVETPAAPAPVVEAVPPTPLTETATPDTAPKQP